MITLVESILNKPNIGSKGDVEASIRALLNPKWVYPEAVTISDDFELVFDLGLQNMKINATMVMEFPVMEIKKITGINTIKFAGNKSNIKYTGFYFTGGILEGINFINEINGIYVYVGSQMTLKNVENCKFIRCGLYSPRVDIKLKYDKSKTKPELVSIFGLNNYPIKSNNELHMAQDMYFNKPEKMKLSKELLEFLLNEPDFYNSIPEDVLFIFSDNPYGGFFIKSKQKPDILNYENSDFVVNRITKNPNPEQIGDIWYSVNTTKDYIKP